ncbi:MAG: GspH/FimT family pseudopilin [Rubrivivax sp.]|nr:GspH/FimT family pseudopilin [Rubrivivax sp.]
MLEPMNARTASAQVGFTLTEMLIVVAVAAVLLTVAVPSFRPLFAKWRLEGAANELSADLQYARSQAVADSANVTFSTTNSSTYSITGNQAYKTVTLPTGVTVNHPASVTFLSQRGCTNATCSATDVSFILANAQVAGTLQLTVNNMGRVRLCSPSGTIKGYPTC